MKRQLLTCLFTGLAFCAFASGDVAGTCPSGIGCDSGILNLPCDRVTVNHGPWLGGAFSTLDITLSNVPDGFDVTDATYAGWCLEDNLNPDFDGDSPLVDSTCAEGDLPATYQPIPWDKVNYLLNNNNGNKFEVQDALYYVAGTNSLATSPPNAAVQAMIDDANANGNGFVAGPGQVTAVAVFIDGIGRFGADPDEWQDTIIEVEVSEVCCLVLDKKCLVETPPVGLDCTDKIAATTLRYIGPSLSAATVEVDPDKGPTVVYTGVNLVTDMTVLVMAEENGFTVDARPDEDELGSKTKIRINGVEEVIHTSCSTPYVAGLPAPLDSPKGAPSPNWFVENFVDKDGDDIVAVPEPQQPSDDCEVVLAPPPSCETEGKPTSLTFLYTGGDCFASTNPQDGKAKCGGDPAGAEPVQVVYTGGNASKFAVEPGSVDVGEEVTITTTDKFESDTELEIRQGGAVLQELKIHTSCSQPLAGGDVFGSLELTAYDGKSAANEVAYLYEVTNCGDRLEDVQLEDRVGSDVVYSESLGDLGTGAVAIASSVGDISETTTNEATVTGSLVNGSECSAIDEVTVTVQEPPVACDEESKVAGMTLIYTGDDCGATTNRQEGKAKCEGDPAGAEPVQMVYTGKDDKKYVVTPAGESIDVGGAVTIARTDGEKFASGTKLEIRQGGDLLQKLEIHTSCSKALAVGDQFGSLLVEDLVLIPK